MEARSAWMSVLHCGTQYLGSAVLINRDGVETMQPLHVYEDPYGILSLVSGQPLNASARSLYPAQRVEAEHLLGWMLLKKAYLFTKNAFKCYRAYVLDHLRSCLEGGIFWNETLRNLM